MYGKQTAIIVTAALLILGVFAQDDAAKTQKTLDNFFKATETLNCDLWVAQFADDYVIQDPADSPPVSGSKAELLASCLEGNPKTFAWMNVTTQYFITGLSASARWNVAGMSKDGCPLTFGGVDSFVLNKAGKIKQLTGYWDPSQMQTQLLCSNHVKKLYARTMEVYSYIHQLDAEKWSAQFTPDAVMSCPMSAPAYHGREAIKAYAQTAFSNYDYYDYVITKDFVVDGQSVVFWRVASASYLGCRIKLLAYNTIIYDEDLQITEWRDYFDVTEEISQMVNCENGTNRPVAPVWPSIFEADFTVELDMWPGFVSKGHLWYDWTTRSQRADYIDWCLPLTDQLPPFMNYTCTYIMRDHTTYYIDKVNPSKPTCCVFDNNLPPPVPDFASGMTYNGTTTVEGQLVSSWYLLGPFPYGPFYYWASVQNNLPVKFKGPTTLNQTTLTYKTVNIHPIPTEAFAVPADCTKICEVPNDTPVDGSKPATVHHRMHHNHVPHASTTSHKATDSETTAEDHVHDNVNPHDYAAAAPKQYYTAHHDE